MEISEQQQTLGLSASEKVSVDIEADRTVGYASIQNAVPVVRAVRITNKSSSDLESVQVIVRCNPAFAKGAHLRFDRLRPDETRTISPSGLICTPRAM